MADQTEKGPGCGTALLVLIAVSIAMDYVAPFVGIKDYLVQIIVGIVLSALIFLSLTYWYMVKHGDDQQPQQPQQRNAPNLREVEISMSNTDEEETGWHYDDFSENFRCRIAGISYRCTPDDIGAFIGTVVPQPDNPADPNALAIIANGGKHIGFVPRKDQKEYNQFTGGGVHPCIGFVFMGKEDEDGPADDDNIVRFGKIKVYKTASKAVVTDMLSYTDWMLRQYNDVRFVPADIDLTVDGHRPKTVAEWQDAIHEAIYGCPLPPSDKG